MSDFLPHPFWNFSLELYAGEGVAEACIDGAQLFNERVQAEVAEEERTKVAGPAPERAASGKVVVEITQQPRRGRGTHSAGGRPPQRGGEPAAEPEVEAPVAPAAE